MKTFNLPECFWELDNTFVEECECSKIFFDVNIDFVEYRIIVCKDWYVQKYKSLMYDIKTDIERPEYMDAYNARDIQSRIIYYIINKYFKTPIFDYLGIKKENCYKGNGSHIGNKWISDTLSYVICERPFMYKKVKLMKFLEFYIYEYKKHDYNRNWEVERMFEDTKKLLLTISEKLLTANKYSKIRPMIKRIKWMTSEDAETTVNDILIEILNELNKLKIEL